ncbi:YmdB family metallophosphoesterase [Patescibacteria group bacterium]|nr:YmdB family metallophosphoesterase [Patescibacteria group bacterium]
MKILYVGEIVAGSGRKAVNAFLPDLLREYDIDFVFSNAENLSGGRGFIQENIEEMTLAGINYYTSGEHVFWQKDTEDYIETTPILRPANYPEGTPGKGHTVIDLGSKGKILLINLMGRTSFGGPKIYLDDPFRKADEILNIYKDEEFHATIVDFHAEATSEKYAMSFYLDGRVTAVLGSHTHVPTCDQRVLPKGTLYVTDVGMTGNIDSVLGVEKDIIINLFLTARNQRFKWESTGTKAFRSVLLDTVEHTIFRIDKLV